jgi:protein-arginine kinase activator protein McsA
VILLENDKVGLYILSHGLFDLTQSIIEAKEDSLEDLKNELQEAIIGEDFEKAALIRDQIKELTGN